MSASSGSTCPATGRWAPRSPGSASSSRPRSRTHTSPGGWWRSRRGAGSSRAADERPGPPLHLDCATPMREKNPVTHDEKLAYLRELREEAVHSASQEAVDKQHEKGKLTARERIEKMLDPGSFEELDPFVRHSLIREARHLLPPPDLRLRDAEATPLRRRRGHGLRDDRRAHRLRLLP